MEYTLDTAPHQAFLSPNEARVLGALVEKEITTPDYYPMTLNALTAACNQKSNRDPVLALSEQDVVQAFDEARKKALARMVEAGASRVPKYRHRLAETLQLTPPQLAILCELFLRGAQTLGELRSRAERMHPFASLTEVEAVLTELSSAEHPATAAAGTPLVVRLPRQAGQKEARYTHLLCGIPTAQEPFVSVAPATNAEAERLNALEEEISALKQELSALREDFYVLKRQLE
ncbi:MAG: YceH family protein [Candidatus Kapabacteria bacterium]|nr:YceH family protein [Candidatus Kapabacteria bacterium]